jgi:hypothetical protein
MLYIVLQVAVVSVRQQLDTLSLVLLQTLRCCDLASI